MDKKLHMIGNAHLDIVWLWPREEGLQEVKATFKSALDRIEETGDFVFTAAGAYYYKFVEENAPELFARIKQQVEAGNWVIVGGWWLQPDCNLPCGESFARHGLYGQGYFREKFERQAVVGYNVDSFGHNGNLPQLLKQSGLDYYVFMRPGQHEKELPGSLFEWEAPDGSSVLAYRIPPGYNQSSRWGDSLIDKISGVARMAEEQNRDLMCFYGVGNHGGGPTRDNLQNIKQLQQEGEYNLEFSSPDCYFDSVKDRYQHPVVADELQFHAIGCYSAQSEIKKNNRLAENRLLMAEKFGVVARVIKGAGYPGADLRQAWQRVLLNQFHDTLGGCSIKPVYRDARNLQGQALALAGDHLNQALQKLSWNVDTGGEGLPVVVFNPQPWPVEATIEVNRPAEAVFDDQGHEYRAQIVTGKALAPWFNFRTIFRAQLPALGYRLFRFRGVDKRLTRDDVELIADRTASPPVLENDYLRVIFDKQLGYIEKIQDKERGLDYLAEEGYGARPLIIEDTTDTWSHGIESYRGLTGEADCRSLNWVEKGPVRDRIRVTHIYGDSTIKQDFILDQGSRQLECRVKVDWQQQHRLLKLGF
ncbi:MAG: alpha-mannosidase, partial [Bacillota bacterium]